MDGAPNIFTGVCGSQRTRISSLVNTDKTGYDHSKKNRLFISKGDYSAYKFSALQIFSKYAERDGLKNFEKIVDK